MPGQHTTNPLSVRGLTGAERDRLRRLAERDKTTVNALVLAAIRERMQQLDSDEQDDR